MFHYVRTVGFCRRCGTHICESAEKFDSNTSYDRNTCDSLSTAVAPASLFDPILDKPTHEVTRIRTYVEPSVALRGSLQTAMRRVGTSPIPSLSPIPPSVRYPRDAHYARRLNGPHRAFYIATPVPGASASKQIFYANLSHPPIHYGAAGEIMYVNRNDIPRHLVGHRRDYHWIVMDAAGKSTGLKLAGERIGR